VRDLEGAMRLDRSKNVSMHVPICTSYDLNELMQVLSLVRRLFFCVSSQK
jgi:hypothetical protein